MISTNQVFASLSTGQALVRKWTVPDDLPYFAGHFPGNPIFPAVGIVDASICVLASILGRSELRVRHIPSAKFTSPISPGLEVRVSAAQLAENEWTLDWSDAQNETTYASLRLKVEE